MANKTLCASLIFVAILSTLFFATGHTRWALSFLTGSGLSIFSMVTIMLAVRVLMRSDSSPKISALLNVLLWMKLPIFGAGLYYVGMLYHGKYTESLLIAIAGMGLIPMLVTLKAIRDVTRDILLEGKRDRGRRKSEDPLPTLKYDVAEKASRTV